MQPLPTPGQPPEYVNPALTSMLMQVMNAQRPAAHRFILMVLPEDNWPTIEEFDDIAVLVARIKEFLGKPVCLFAFLGNRLTITAGDNRYLMTPMGSIPLFELPDPEQATAAEFGWVGPSMDKPRAPTDEDGGADLPDETEPDAAPQPVDESPQDDSGVDSNSPTASTDTPIF